MDRHTLLVFFLATAIVTLSVHAEDDVEVTGDGDSDGRTFGLIKKYHNRYAYSQPLLGGGGGILSSLFGGLGGGHYGGSPYYNPYYGHGYGHGGSPFIGGRPANPGGYYRPGGYPPGYGGYQAYPGGYGGGFY